MSSDSFDNFPEVVSRPGWVVTWLLRLVLGVLFLVMCFLFFALPVGFYLDGYNDVGVVVLMGCYDLLLVWLLWLMVKYMRRNLGKSVVKIVVDGRGIHYHRLDGSAESLLYLALEKSGDSFADGDVFAKTVGIGESAKRVLMVRSGKAERRVTFHTHIVSYFTVNRRELLVHFLRGIVLFRPDLKIEASVYASFYIRRDTMEFDKKGYWLVMVGVVVFLVLFFLVLDWYMRYRTGSGLIF
uniref:hypothetical protein n=1 Tax=Pedobacter schmidteae TaxID=2201271 RepID=UPI000EABCF5A|nr:hypothetical protein [Pedobacter schmidteae]